ncbi:sulfite exporter TauE/SafE family protein [Candidatus Soleaferrea massiliensis]|uniref:sulfite exporter TauE/SafE family protein n=1 Tax=Candidatus Soleaferrea massiliensis TaxID=1470354 RepID=UPI00058B7DF6|nr:sulfite exporter TauE/SafE family protein [Candidatus Soleaferrea massiliensis]
MIGLIIAAFFAAIAGSLGLGGGGILLLYLTAFADYEQLKAQGINLIFFIPCAIIALIIHAKNKLIEWKATLVCGITGLAGVALGFYLAGLFDPKWLGKAFAVFLLFLGLKELFHREKDQKKP